jgi:hypothetical protein
MDIVDAYTLRVNLRSYPRFWKDFRDVVTTMWRTNTVCRAHEFKVTMSELYNLDVDIHVGDIVGIVYMRHEDAVWFNLQWS